MTSWMAAVKMISLVTLWCTLNLETGCALLLCYLVFSGPEMCVMEHRRNCFGLPWEQLGVVWSRKQALGHGVSHMEEDRQGAGGV